MVFHFWCLRAFLESGSESKYAIKSFLVCWNKRQSKKLLTSLALKENFEQRRHEAIDWTCSFNALLVLG